MQAARFNLLLFLLGLGVRIVATLQSVDTSEFSIVIAQHAAHRFLVLATDRREHGRFDEFGHAFLASFLRFLSDLTVRELIARIEGAPFGLDHGRCHLANGEPLGTFEFETFLGFSFLILFHFLKTGDARFGDRGVRSGGGVGGGGRGRCHRRGAGIGTTRFHSLPLVKTFP